MGTYYFTLFEVLSDKLINYFYELGSLSSGYNFWILYLDIIAFIWNLAVLFLFIVMDIIVLISDMMVVAPFNYFKGRYSEDIGIFLVLGDIFSIGFCIGSTWMVYTLLRDLKKKRDSVVSIKLNDQITPSSEEVQ